MVSHALKTPEITTEYLRAHRAGRTDLGTDFIDEERKTHPWISSASLHFNDDTDRG